MGNANMGNVNTARITIGVLALQGAFSSHERAFARAREGVTTRQVRLPRDLDGVDALAMPGGESTTMSQLLESSGLFDAIGARIASGMPVFGTCAGVILLANSVLDGRDDQRSFASLNVTVRRNGYGRQIDSFESNIEVMGLEAPFPAVFIRAPIIESVGADVHVLASHDGVPVAVATDRIVG
ncbi:MAG: pyridoxal 5'-phosphate synthase glutaminase subunit PdxT, partial [Actinomycetota bacterium]